MRNSPESAGSHRSSPTPTGAVRGHFVGHPGSLELWVEPRWTLGPFGALAVRGPGVPDLGEMEEEREK